jgi:type II secretory pathway component PulF
MRSAAEKIALTVGLLCAVITAAVAETLVPQFRAVFEGFQAEVPALTKLALYYYHALWLLPLVVLGIWYGWPKPRHRALFSCLTGIVALVIVIPALVYVLYLPILNLGQAS